MGGCVSSLDSAMSKVLGNTVKSVKVNQTNVNIIKKPALDTVPINLVIPIFTEGKLETAILDVEKDDQVTIEAKLNKVFDTPTVKAALKDNRIAVVPITDWSEMLKNIIFVQIDYKPTTAKDSLKAALLSIFLEAEKLKLSQVTIPRLAKADAAQFGGATDDQIAQVIWETCCSHLAKNNADGHHISDVFFAVKEESYLKAITNAFQPLVEPEKEKAPEIKAS